MVAAVAVLQGVPYGRRGGGRCAERGWGRELIGETAGQEGGGPAYSEEQIEQGVTARAARKSIFDRDPAPELGFILEEWTLRRPPGGRTVLRGQLEHLLVTGQLRNVELQVMQTEREEHASVNGAIEVLKFEDGTAVGRTPGIANGRPVSDPRQLRILELRYGIVRAQALAPRESAAFSEHLLGET